MYINDLHQARQFTQKMKEDGKAVARKIWKSEEEYDLILQVFDLFDAVTSAEEKALQVCNFFGDGLTSSGCDWRYGIKTSTTFDE